MTTRVKVSMAMPVYNGEAYVEAALRSLGAQTYEDYELLISDNASTDRTEQICRDIAAGDPRIRYARRPVNVGFARNQNDVIRLSRGEYFLLTHHDDLRAPDYLARTVEVLDSDPTVSVCYTGTQDIDERGDPVARVDPPLRLDAPDRRIRFREIIRMDHICEPDFGLTRNDLLQRSGLHGDYADSDRVLLAELILQGPFRKIPDFLFFRRAHAAQSTAVAQDRVSRTVWFNPRHAGKLLFPHFRQLREYLSVIARVRMGPADRLWCRREMLRWAVINRRRLRMDLTMAGVQLARPVYRTLVKRSQT